MVRLKIGKDDNYKLVDYLIPNHELLVRFLIIEFV